MKLTLNDIQDAMGAIGFLGDAGETVPTGVQTDSRMLQKGELFFCISGERFDGHTFARAAVERGACGVVAERPPFSADEMCGMECDEGGVPLLMVRDSVQALGRLAAYHRQKAKAAVVGVTGTAGKTTVKEMLAQVLSVRGETARNHLNLNNQIGLPVSMLAATGEERFWVMEAGISEPRDMDELASVLRPDLGIVLNVGAGHTQGLGDKGVAHYKAKLLSYIAPGGVGLVSADYPDLVREARSNCAELRFFSIRDASCMYRAEYAGPQSATQGRYRVWLDKKEFELVAPFRGAFAAENVIAVAAAADILGLSTQEIITGFAQARLPEKRFCCQQRDRWLVIDDSYNANPLSALRMLETAHEMAAGQPLMLVMGEMLELGDEAEKAHRDLGIVMARTAPAAVYWKGGHADEVRAGLTEGGWQGELQLVHTPEEFINRFMESTLRAGLVLFKGSRGNRLERLVEAFCAGPCSAKEEPDAL
ncbi:UDP-N-acetylmuramoyl-tripeptide--D-alanyl-D-alanine ligase [Desulfovibrio psychrotolerans]|uniref:UDP-N-acetylmuramoyl-tripeptide--D-alanyl-D-alanine ligase n=1 Tax=Desulfovibrio psychrotolerans TaxID=415242 RepID=A0A7J0BSH9_9BACT|nr:UDP-N-acetylmuramoyl-tripeptide--D-alanyl-D-alanine ligase [Desulfovibrio psychrotolerans]GFM36676.1 UDP-N-acetylmuramoyl-tripeptide--D-alanyl-D-alanine ligase [Desulfovibrio psychrotolerans]